MKTISSRGPGLVVGTLMIPVIMLILNMSMFGVALPSVQSVFALRSDALTWLVTAFFLPTMALMPVYGRLGDVLPKRAVLVGGLVVFLIGSIVCFLGTTPAVVVLGRLLQGLGASGINPLGLAIISDAVAQKKRGKALGVWHTAGPLGGLIGPVLAGLLIEGGNWRTIFLPIAGAAALSIVVLLVGVPAADPDRRPRSARSMDWSGVGLAAAVMTLMTIYVSSGPITGARPLTDWRIALALIAAMAGLLIVERRRENPVVDLKLLGSGPFLRASLTYGIRRLFMTATGVLVPLHLSNLLGQPPGTIGFLMALSAVGLIGTLTIGGLIADRVGAGAAVRVGMAIQAGTVLLLAAAPLSTLSIGAAVLLGGLAGGLSMAGLDIVALGKVDRPRLSSAASLYFMFGSGGTLMGAAIAGVALQSALDRGLAPLPAYRITYLIFVVFGLLGFAVSPGAGVRTVDA